VVAGICGILFGAFGVHKFILGRTWQGMTMLLVTVLSFFLAYPLMHFLGFVEGMIYLIKDDEEFYRDYIVGRRGWL
jgi:TM2 domain-containing membrane protein YozV